MHSAQCSSASQVPANIICHSKFKALNDKTSEKREDFLTLICSKSGRAEVLNLCDNNSLSLHPYSEPEDILRRSRSTPSVSGDSMKKITLGKEKKCYSFKNTNNVGHSNKSDCKLQQFTHSSHSFPNKFYDGLNDSNLISKRLSETEKIDFTRDEGNQTQNSSVHVANDITNNNHQNNFESNTSQNTVHKETSPQEFYQQLQVRMMLLIYI